MAGSSEYQGKTYYFCSPACKERFDAEPSRFLVQRINEER
jgi:Cu+-exporting ATPase